jgi:hypothetical protein
MLRQRPRWWPRFSSTLRSTALTARIGTALGVAITLLFVTGLLCHYQYEPWTWLPPPAKPAWGSRLTQGIHVATGMATVPLLLVKLWSVYPNLFRFPRSGRSGMLSSGPAWRSWSPRRWCKWPPGS